MPSINFYSPIGQALLGETRKVGQLGSPTRGGPLAPGAWEFGRRVVPQWLDALEKRKDKKSRAAILSALVGDKFEYDPSKAEESFIPSQYLETQRVALKDAQAQAQPESALGLSPDDIYSPDILPPSQSDDLYSPDILKPEELIAQPPSPEIEALFGSDPATNAKMQAALIATPEEELEAWVGSPEERAAQERAYMETVHSPDEEAKRMAELVASNPDIANHPGYQQWLMSHLGRKQRLRDEETERGRAARLLEEERAFITLTAENLADANNKKARESGAGETWGKTPVWGTDAEGNDVLGVISDLGNFKQIETPEGFDPDRDITGDRALDTARVARLTNRVDKGVAAAQAVPILKRSLELLEGIETGGLASIQLKTRRIFGVEGANEAELSYNLGKSVLGQLKSTFGAAFTAGEAKKLEDLEAGLGKSTAGNIRIIKNLLRQSEQYYKQGLKAAFDSDDLSTYEAMSEAYGLTYGASDDEAGAEARTGNETGEKEITEDDIQLTMKNHNMTREDVMNMLREQGRK